MTHSNNEDRIIGGRYWIWLEEGGRRWGGFWYNKDWARWKRLTHQRLDRRRRKPSVRAWLRRGVAGVIEDN